MKTSKVCASLLTVLAFFPVGRALAGDPPAPSEDMPAILSALDSGKVTILDDQAAGAIRGQDYQYVLVRTFLNAYDFAPGLTWTLNPFGYRYGAWGGPGWTNGGGVGPNTAADDMDALFRQHDEGTLSDLGLIAALQGLATTPHAFWGATYVPANGLIEPEPGLPANARVWVSGISALGGRFFLGWRPMRFPEYSRREALAGMQLLSLLP